MYVSPGKGQEGQTLNATRCVEMLLRPVEICEGKIKLFGIEGRYFKASVVGYLVFS